MMEVLCRRKFAMVLVLICSSEIWGDLLPMQSQQRTQLPVQRGSVFRAVSAYPKVSVPTALIISDVIPVDLSAQA